MDQLKALIVGGRKRDGRELAADVMRCVGGLLEAGCSAGDRVAVLLRNSYEQLVITLAAQHLGAYPVQMNWHSQAAELHYVLDDCAARLLVAHNDLLTALDPARMKGLRLIGVAPDTALRHAYGIPESATLAAPDMQDWLPWLEHRQPADVPAAPAVESVIYTSGTTGKPKGVRRFAATARQREMTEQMRQQVFGISADSRVLVPAPIYHTAPHLFATRAVRKAEALLLSPRFDAESFLRDIAQHRISHVYLVPTMFVRLLALPPEIRQRYDLASLKFALHAGGPCAPDIKRRMIEWLGPVIFEYYGSTEAGPSTFCTSEDALSHPGTVGRAASGVHIEIHDDDGRPLPPGQVGEICVRNEGYADFTYLNRAADRAELQRGDLLTSGDLGYCDTDGYYYLCDRKRDLVISGGVNIYPVEIEATLMELPAIADCAVFGIPDDEFGESLVALIHPHPGQVMTIEQVANHLRSRLAAFKVPRRIELRQESLPRDEAGKIRKRLLREAYREASRPLPDAAL